MTAKRLGELDRAPDRATLAEVVFCLLFASAISALTIGPVLCLAARLIGWVGQD